MHSTPGDQNSLDFGNADRTPHKAAAARSMPIYSDIGVWAPVRLVSLRLLQGLAVN